MTLVALWLLLSAYLLVASAHSQVEHDAVGAVPSHLSSEPDSNSESNENAVVQLCIFVIFVTCSVSFNF